jgi:hypothetical protein
MKIYFIASPRGLDEFGNLYKEMYDFISKLGNIHVNDFIIKTVPNEFYSRDYNYRIAHYKRVMKAIRDCDIAVVEISIHSMTMGYIVDKALSQGKPVIVLFQKGFDPYFFSGMEQDKLQLVEYTRQNMKRVIKQALDIAKDQLDIRFTFLISSQLKNYLDFIYSRKGIDRSVFIRQLIANASKQDLLYKKDKPLVPKQKKV